jgi:hypothetical protein
VAIVVEWLVVGHWADWAAVAGLVRGGGGGRGAGGLTDWLDEGAAAVVDVEPRRDGEEVSWLVSRGENVIGVLVSASRVKEETSAALFMRGETRNMRDY